MQQTQKADISIWSPTSTISKPLDGRYVFAHVDSIEQNKKLDF